MELFKKAELMSMSDKFLKLIGCADWRIDLVEINDEMCNFISDSNKHLFDIKATYNINEKLSNEFRSRYDKIVAKIDYVYNYYTKTLKMGTSERYNFTINVQELKDKLASLHSVYNSIDIIAKGELPKGLENKIASLPEGSRICLMALNKIKVIYGESAFEESDGVVTTEVIDNIPFEKIGEVVKMVSVMKDTISALTVFQDKPDYDEVIDMLTKSYLMVRNMLYSLIYRKTQNSTVTRLYRSYIEKELHEEFDEEWNKDDTPDNDVDLPNFTNKE